MAPNFNEKVISSPSREKEFFRDVVEKKSRAEYGTSFEELPRERQEEAVKKAVEEHKEVAPAFSSEDFLEKQREAEKIVLALDPEEDDEKMEELLGLVQEKGILNTINAIEKTETFHILDDFHRLLVQYIKAGQPSDVRESSPLYPGLHMTLFEVLLPEDSSKEDREKNLELLLSSMEQFYAGMFSVAESGGKKQNYFSIEIAYPQGRNEVVFFSAVPDEKKNIFKNQVLAIFPNASIKENTNDYNIFNKKEYVAYSEAFLTKSFALPIKTYKDLNYDPLNIILQSFSNLDKEEGAAIQIMLSPDNRDTNAELVKILDKLAKGDDIDSTLKVKRNLVSKFLSVIDETILSSKSDKEKEQTKDSEKRSLIMEEVKKKNSSRFYRANIRLITSGNDNYHAGAILSELESAFHQFEDPLGNGFDFKKFEGSALRKKVRDYTFRVFDRKNFSYFNTTELTTIFHFPEVSLKAGDILSTSSFTSAGVSKKLAMESEALSQKPARTFAPIPAPSTTKDEVNDSLAMETREEKVKLAEEKTFPSYTLQKPDDS